MPETVAENCRKGNVIGKYGTAFRAESSSGSCYTLDLEDRTR